MALGVAVILVAGACDGDPEHGAPRTSPTPRTSPVASADLLCEEQEQALEDPEAHELAGDVDADGAPDRVVIAPAVGECPPVLVVVTARRALSVPIEEEVSGPGLPRLMGLVEMGDGAGAEVVMVLAAGASTEFFGVYTAVDNELDRLRIRGPSRFGDLFPSGGSVGHMEASDCAGDGRVVISSAVPNGDRYLVERRFYDVDGGVLRRAGRGDRLVDLDALGSIPEFGSTPFGSCSPG